jgi:hypothetical protein
MGVRVWSSGLELTRATKCRYVAYERRSRRTKRRCYQLEKQMATVLGLDFS